MRPKLQRSPHPFDQQPHIANESPQTYLQSCSPVKIARNDFLKSPIKSPFDSDEILPSYNGEIFVRGPVDGLRRGFRGQLSKVRNRPSQRGWQGPRSLWGL